MNDQKNNFQSNKMIHSPILRGMFSFENSFKNILTLIPKSEILDHSNVNYSEIISTLGKSLETNICIKLKKVQENEVINKRIEIETSKNNLPIVSIKRNLANTFDNQIEEILAIQKKMGSLKLDKIDIEEQINENVQKKNISKITEDTNTKRKATKIDNVQRKKRKVDKTEVAKEKKNEIIQDKVIQVKINENVQKKNITKITEDTNTKRKATKMDDVQRKKIKVDNTEVAKEKKNEIIQDKVIQVKVIEEKNNKMKTISNRIGSKETKVDHVQVIQKNKSKINKTEDVKEKKNEIIQSKIVKIEDIEENKDEIKTISNNVKKIRKVHFVQEMRLVREPYNLRPRAEKQPP